MNTILEAKNLTKVYPGTIALSDFSASFGGGKVHAVIGKNGSGKSTLMKIFSGAIRPTEGGLSLDGRSLEFHEPDDAFRQGIAMVYQELSLIPELTVAENIYLNRYTKKRGLIDWQSLSEMAEKLLLDLGLEIGTDVKVASLSVGQQQLVEIAKAMSFDPAVLILDEPTSALARHETNRLFELVKTLRDRGVIILYISHRLQELDEIADTVTVLRDGEWIGTVDMADITPAKIVEMMFGETEQKQRPADLQVREEVLLEVSRLTRSPAFHDVSFSLRGGEVLGIAGMLGSGRTELLRAIFGADSYDSGEIMLDGKTLSSRSGPARSRDLGLAMIPENRKTEGLVLRSTIRQNMCMASMERIASNGIITKAKENEVVARGVDDLQIKLGSPEDPATSLSGGNQQKIVIGNWLGTEPRVILFDEPSRGIDVNAKQQIFQIMWDLSRNGLSSIFVSTELEELLEVCHRILIMKDGRITGEVYPENIGLEDLYSLCMEDYVQ